MIDVSVLVDKLNGMDCAEIREFLGSQEIKGLTQVSHQCPIANWIHRESGYYVTVENAVGVFEDEDTPNFSLELGSGPREFIDRFDSGLFPELAIPDSFCEDDDYGLMDDYDSV